MSIVNSEREYQEALKKAHEEFPMWKHLDYTPETCPGHDYSFIVFCDGGDWDIGRCRKCGAEAVVRCTFDDDFD